MSDFKNIVLEFNDGVATMTFNRPEVRNSLDTETLSEIHRALGMVEDNGEAGVLVLTGAGEAFCAGVNLKGYTLDERENFRAGFREVAMWLCHGNYEMSKIILSVTARHAAATAAFH
jgi:enoyl-CoA hydratase/carnithine racemase